MKEFEKFISETHPDPDRLLKDESIYNDFVKLAEEYAKTKCNMHVVKPTLLCIDLGDDIGLTVGKKYNRFFLSDGECLIKDDFGELCVLKLKNFKVIGAQ